jgi:hypothetical protein
MPTICYKPLGFQRASRRLIEVAVDIVTDFMAQGYSLTLRGLYYRMVAGNHIPNTPKSYKRFQELINNARLGGQMDWDSIYDATRRTVQWDHWDSPEDAVEAAANTYAHDKWVRQAYRPEVWFEKDAIVNVVEPVCMRNDVPFLSCRGSTSQSEMWRSAMRLQGVIDAGQIPVIIHLADHDPTGVDMSRDVLMRLTMFLGGDDDFVFERVALNMDQIKKYNPPPQPAKVTDSRYARYTAKYGRSSWEMDALTPPVMTALIEDKIHEYRDEVLWDQDVLEQERKRDYLRAIATGRPNGVLPWADVK